MGCSGLDYIQSLDVCLDWSMDCLDTLVMVAKTVCCAQLPFQMRMNDRTDIEYGGKHPYQIVNVDEILLVVVQER